jgi:hypothetical protein
MRISKIREAFGRRVVLRSIVEQGYQLLTGTLLGSKEDCSEERLVEVHDPPCSFGLSATS